MHKANITISRPSYSDGKEVIKISVVDEDARINFLTLELSYDAFAKALTGLAYVDCEMELRNLDCVGKMIERGDIEFPMPACEFSKRSETAALESQSHTPEGWVASEYYGSKDSFFNRDDIEYARTSISRWVDKL